MKPFGKKVIARMSLALVAGLVLVLGLPAQNGGGITPRAAADLEQNGFQSMASNDSLELYVNEETGIVAVWSFRDQQLWYSSPLQWEEDERAAGANRLALGSGLSLRKANDLGTMQPLNSAINVVNRGGLTVEATENGMKLEYNFIRDEFVIPVEYVLDGDSVLVRVPLKDVKEPSFYNEEKIKEWEEAKAAAAEAAAEAAKEAAQSGTDDEDEDEDYGYSDFEEDPVPELKLNTDILNRITLQPYFGAQAAGTKGFLMIPDGSGALIRFDNNRSSESLELPVYGSDPSIDILYKRDVKQDVTLPVFGLGTEEGGFLGIIEDGAARSLINAETSGQKTSYNSVSVSYVFRDLDVVSVAERVGTNRDIRVFDKRLPDDQYFSVRYMFLPKGKSDYADMATKYREYLQERKAIRKMDPVQSNPFFLTLFGAGQQVKPILGIPMEVTTPYTTFDDARSIMETLQKGGAKDLVVNYQSWVSGGDEAGYPDGAGVEGALGGEGGMRNLNAWAKEHGVKMFYDADLVRLYRSSLFFFKEVVAARRIFNTVVDIPYYKLSTYDKDDSRSPVALIRPIEVAKAVERFINAFRRMPDAGVALSSVGNTVYSDFIAQNGMGRSKVATTYGSILQSVHEQRPVLLERPMGYALPATDYATGLPSVSSRYDMVDASIPFMAMVLRGSVPFSLEAGNNATSLKDWTLRCLEYGAQPHFKLIARNVKELKETRFQTLFDCDASRWIDDAMHIGTEIQGVLEKVKGQPITGHRIASDRVRVTTYGNGISIAVNYGNKAVTLEGGIAVPARAYTVFRGNN